MSDINWSSFESNSKFNLQENPVSDPSTPIGLENIDSRQSTQQSDQPFSENGNASDFQFLDFSNVHLDASPGYKGSENDTSMPNMGNILDFFRDQPEGHVNYVGELAVNALPTPLDNLQSHRMTMTHGSSGRGHHNGSIGIPPTPNSMELHSVTPTEVFRSPMTGPIDKSSAGLRNSDTLFTPLVSPAVTPLEVASAANEFGMEASFFSPISSPALEAQGYPVFGTQPSSAHMQRQSEPPEPGVTRRSGRKTRASAAAASTRVAKLSPLVRPQRRKSGSTRSSAGLEHWSSDSVSPDNFPELAMPPPQKKEVRNINPLISTSTSTSSSNKPSVQLVPATPASLMNLPNQKQQKQIPNNSDGQHLDNALRATSNASSAASSISTSPTAVTLKPRMSQNSSSSWKPSRSSSVSASPVIMPKMSPQNGPEDPQWSNLLASKSNYQNIVEGNHNQLGLSYPDHLSANLTSKRTSHKLAEQGRRNRINSALSDLGRLLSPTLRASSKANTVEMAITYIQQLQAELEETKARLRKYENED